MIPTTGRILAIDWGEIRIGLALSDETQTLATPAGNPGPPRRQAVPYAPPARSHTPYHLVGLVAGLPLTPEGREEESAIAARDAG